MLSAFLETLPISVGIVVSTLPLAGVALLLNSRPEKGPYVFFALGWSLAGFVFGIAAVLISDLIGPSQNSQPLWLLLLRFALGVALLVFAYSNIKSWSNSGNDDEESNLIQKIGSMEPRAVFFVGAGFAVVNPKNAALFASGAFAVDAAAVGATEKLPAFAAFMFVASLQVLSPTVLNVLLGARAEQVKNTFKLFLERHGGLVGGIVLLLIGFVVISDVWSDYVAG